MKEKYIQFAIDNGFQRFGAYNLIIEEFRDDYIKYQLDGVQKEVYDKFNNII